MNLIYNCGYRTQLKLKGKITNKKYIFRKRSVTRVDDKDGEVFLKMTARDIPWCPTNSKTIPPFMTLEDWCNAKPERFDKANPTKYDPKEYLEQFLLK